MLDSQVVHLNSDLLSAHLIKLNELLLLQLLDIDVDLLGLGVILLLPHVLLYLYQVQNVGSWLNTQN
jgi:hypothetical protein